MYLSRQLTGRSYAQIGAFFGGRDHTTVLHGCRKTGELLKTDSGIRQAVAELRQQITAVPPRGGKPVC
jgi:chromosomal replication initiator protein